MPLSEERLEECEELLDEGEELLLEWLRSFFFLRFGICDLLTNARQNCRRRGQVQRRCRKTTRGRGAGAGADAAGARRAWAAGRVAPARLATRPALRDRRRSRRPALRR